jgi:hypothetical protein
MGSGCVSGRAAGGALMSGKGVGSVTDPIGGAPSGGTTGESGGGWESGLSGPGGRALGEMAPPAPKGAGWQTPPRPGPTLAGGLDGKK